MTPDDEMSLDLDGEDEMTDEQALAAVAYALQRARQLLAIWSRKTQEHFEVCDRAARCRRCVALTNFLAGLTRMLHVFEDGDWGRDPPSTKGG